MRESRIVLPPNAGVAELADALVSKSSGRKVVWVRAPPPAMISKSCADDCNAKLNLVR